MPQPGGPESEPRPDDSIHIRLSRRELLKYAKIGLVAGGGALAWGAFQRIFPAGESPVPPSVKAPTPQPLSPAERAALPQKLIEEIERERGVATPTPAETLKNWKKYEYGPRFIVADIQMSASVMIPEGWYGAEVPQGSEIWPAFRLTEEWFPPNGSWGEYLKSGKGWVIIGLTRTEGSEVSREDYSLGQPVAGARKGKVSTTSFGGMLGSIYDTYLKNEKPDLWFQTFVAFLERTDRVLLIRYGSETDRQKATEPVLKRIAQSLQFSIMPDYAVGRGRKIVSITPRIVSGTEDWKTYHYFTRHKDPWASLKKPLMEIALLLPPQWQFIGCEENTGGYPCFSFGENKSGERLGRNLDDSDAYGLSFIDEAAGGISLEKYLRRLLDDSFVREETETKITGYSKEGLPSLGNIKTGRWKYKLAKENEIANVAVGRYRGKAQDFELVPGDAAKEKDVPLWVKSFSTPLADGTDRRFTIFFKGPLARRSELESTWDKVIQSIDLRFYHKLE